MCSNEKYNLVNQYVTEHKTLYRIKNMYRKDAGDCKNCLKFWDKLEKDKKDHVEELEKLIKDHFCE